MIFKYIENRFFFQEKRRRIILKEYFLTALAKKYPLKIRLQLKKIIVNRNMFYASLILNYMCTTHVKYLYNYTNVQYTIHTL